MQHLQKQSHPRVRPDLMQQPRPCHRIVLSLCGYGLHFEIAEQPHQHPYEFYLRELASGTAAGAAGPADEWTVAGRKLLEMLSWMR